MDRPSNESTKSRRLALVHYEKDIQMAMVSEQQEPRQGKLGTIGRRRQSVRPSIKTKHSTTIPATETRQPFGKLLSLKQLGMRLSGKSRQGNKKQPLSKGKTKTNNDRGAIRDARPQHLQRESVVGLSGLHIAAQNNNAAKISDLVKRGADVNLKSSIDYATPLHMAARYDCAEAAVALIQNGADVSDALINGQTPLHVCCRRGFLDVAVVLIMRGKADVNSRDIDKSNPLHQATLNGDIELVTYLVENGANIRAIDINNVTPVMQAAQGGFKECVQYLLAMAMQKCLPIEKCLSDKDNEGNTALHLAVGNRHIDVAKALIERGAPVNGKKATNGFTPLHQAAIIGEEVLVQMLIDRGAETEVHDKEQMTPLHRAAMYNRVETILLLIRQGLYLDSKDKDNFTPLTCAAWKGQTDAGRSLLRYGADINVRDMEMKTVLHWAVELQHLQFAKMLFEHGHGGGELLNLKDRSEQTALHYAAEVGNVAVLNLLTENGAEVVVKDVSEKTPLHIASEFGHFDCVKALYQACPVPLNDDDINDMTPLLLASENGHHRVVRYLITVGADIESRNDDRRSALALAASNNEMHVLNVLLENNANVDGCDKDQNTPLHLSAQAGFEGPAVLLINNGADLRLQNIRGMYPLDLAIENKQEAVAKAILSSDSWEVAMNNINASGLSPMRSLIEHLPEAALLVMDQCITKSHTDPRHPDLKIGYNYRYIDPGPDDITFDKTNQRYFALETMVDFKREKLLAHDLSQASLSSKWKHFARYFNYSEFFMYLIFVVMVSVYLRLNTGIRKMYPHGVDGCPRFNASSHEGQRSVQSSSNLSLNDTSEYDDDNGGDIRRPGMHHMHHAADALPHLPIHDKTAMWVQLSILSFVIFKAVLELMHIANQRVDNYLHWTLFIVTFIFVWPPYLAPCDVQWVAGAIAVFVSWMNFIFVLNRFDFFGLYVTMFFTTLKSLLKAMSVYVFFIVGFALAFHICFEESNESFRNEWTSIITTFVMTLGEINKSDVLDTGESLHPFGGVANFLFVIFLFLMPMVLINLTIGISVGDIEQIMESSYFKRFSLQIRPYLRSSSDVFLKKSRVETHRKISIEDVMTRVMKHEQGLSSLTMLVQQQGKILNRIAEKHDINVDVETPILPLMSPKSPKKATTATSMR